MELRQLRSFVALAEELHFGRAARQENIGQPALSLQLARLETELGVRLFDRTSRRVHLTEAGLAVLDHARLAVRHAEAVAETARLVTAGRHGSLRVAYATGVDSTEAIELVASFRASHPGIELQPRLEVDSRVLSRLSAGEVDVGIVWLPPALPRGLAVQVLLTERVVAAVSRSNPLVDDQFVSAEMIARQPLVLPPRDQAPAMWALVSGQVLTAADGTRGPVYEEPGQVAIMRAVARDGLVSLLPASVARNLRVDGVVYRPCFRPPLELRLGMVWQRTEESSPLQLFLAHCQAGMPESPDAPGLLPSAPHGGS